MLKPAVTVLLTALIVHVVMGRPAWSSTTRDSNETVGTRSMHNVGFPDEDDAFGKPQKLVEVQPGRKMNLLCAGRGSPTIVVDAGLSLTMLSWNRVLPAISRLSQVCAYDRAGLGFSDPGSFPRDSLAMAGDLHLLLHKAGIQPPYIIAAHSMAGLNALLFAEKWRGEVAGLVLVDPSYPGQYPQLSTTYDDPKSVFSWFPNHLKRCEKLAEHRIRLTSDLRKECLTTYDDDGPNVQAATSAQERRPSYWKSLASEYENLEDLSGGGLSVDDREVESALKPLDRLPLIVLTAPRNAAPGQTSDQLAKNARYWNAGHDRIAALSTIGRNEQVSGTDHSIQSSRPDVVVRAIEAILTEARPNSSNRTAIGNKSNP